ncbi:MAG: ATP-binding protein [Desulfobacteraceae bacterium]
MTIKRLLELHDLAKEESRKYERKRFLFPQLMRDRGRHFTGIVGARGIGKTVLLRQYAIENDQVFYLSADTLDRDDDAWELIRKLNQHYGFRMFLLDEIHFLPDPTALLKQLYDFVDVRIMFSSSVALAMQASAYDLSRRVRLMNLHGFSFREYLAFNQGILLPPLQLNQIAEEEWKPEHLLTGRHFDDYLKGGVLPFSLEEPDPLSFLERITEKVIARDIPSVLRLAVDELETIRRLLRFVGRSAVDGINYSSLSRNLGITKYKAEQYVGCLEKAFLLHRVFPAGTNVLREPKVVMTPPNRLLYRDFEDAVGGLREDYFVETMKQAGIGFQYLKTTRGAKTPDYLIEAKPPLAVEIGGPGKGRQQFKGIKVDRKLIFTHSLVPEKGRIPLFLLGFLA